MLDLRLCHHKVLPANSIVSIPLQVDLSNTLSILTVDSTIRANYANFGYMPYGQTIIGKLHYDPKHPKACEEFEEGMKLNRTDDISPFWIAQRGDCSFVQKVRNLENVGVAVAIVIDNRAEMIDEILMSDDGTGGGIRIPSMLIGKTDG